MSLGPQIWFRLNGGVWNGSSSANPTTGVGGIPLNVTGTLSYATYTGSAGTMTFNFGQNTFSYAVPDGFTAGWPTADLSGWTTLDPAKNQGEAVLSDGNLTVNSPSSNGATQSVDGWADGRFYFECENDFNSFFTNGMACGVATSIDLTHASGWPDGSGITGGDIASSPGFEADAWSFGVIRVPSIFELGNATIVSVAVVLASPAFSMSNLQVVEANNANLTANRDVMLRWSDDMGANWGNPLTQTLGKTGEYETNVQFLRLGQGRFRVWELSWTGAMASALTNLFVIADTSGS